MKAAMAAAAAVAERAKRHLAALSRLENKSLLAYFQEERERRDQEIGKPFRPKWCLRLKPRFSKISSPPKFYHLRFVLTKFRKVGLIFLPLIKSSIDATYQANCRSGRGPGKLNLQRWNSHLRYFQRPSFFFAPRLWHC